MILITCLLDFVQIYIGRRYILITSGIKGLTIYFPLFVFSLFFSLVVFDYISKRLFEKLILFRGDSLAQNMARILLM